MICPLVFAASCDSKSTKKALPRSEGVWKICTASVRLATAARPIVSRVASITAPRETSSVSSSVNGAVKVSTLTFLFQLIFRLVCGESLDGSKSSWSVTS